MSLWCQKMRVMGYVCHPGDIYFSCSHNQVFKFEDKLSLGDKMSVGLSSSSVESALISVFKEFL